MVKSQSTGVGTEYNGMPKSGWVYGGSKVLILNHDLFSYFHIGNVNTQTTVDEPGPQLVVEHPPQGLFPLSGHAASHDLGLKH